MGRSCRTTRFGTASSTISPTKTSSTISSQDVGGPGELHLLESDDYANVTWESLGVRRRSKIAVLNAVGAITSGRGGYDPVNGAVLGSDSLVEYIRDIRGDASIRAIVLRIDSPGGSSTASDVIWRELTITKGDPHKRPIIVSMSDLAASGGYYVAMAGDVIVAQPGTLTGSIGIYTGKFVTGGTFDKLGANIDVTSNGRHAEIYSPDRRFTPEERAQDAGVDAGVLRSVRREGRRGAPHLAGEDRSDRAGTGVDRAAGASRWAWSISSAVCRSRCSIAKQRARIPADEEVELVVYPPRRSFYEVLSEQFEQPSGAQRAAPKPSLSLLGPRDRSVLARSSPRPDCSAPARSWRTCRTCSCAESFEFRSREFNKSPRRSNAAALSRAVRLERGRCQRVSELRAGSRPVGEIARAQRVLPDLDLQLLLRLGHVGAEEAIAALVDELGSRRVDAGRRPGRR